MEIARKFGLDVSFIDLDKEENKYDVISFLNVFSHLPYPVATIQKWRTLLKDNGEIFLETGNSSHLTQKHHGKPYLLPDHLSFANKKIMVDLLERCGFKVMNVEIYRGIYDSKRNLYNMAKELIKFLIGRKNRFLTFFEKYHHGDMFIRARKV